VRGARSNLGEIVRLEGSDLARESFQGIDFLKDIRRAFFSKIVNFIRCYSHMPASSKFV